MVATQANDIGIIVYAPPYGGDRSRPLAVVHGMERAHQGVRLEWTVSDEGLLTHLPQRDAWLLQESTEWRMPFLCNGDERYPFSISGWEGPAGISPGGQARFEVHAAIPYDAAGIAAAAAVLEGVAEGSRAFWGHATPFNTGVEIAGQVRHPRHKPGVPPRGLPTLQLSEFIRSSEIPLCLGWLNYWSAAAAQAIGFPDPARDADLLSRARRTASGGWIVSLTEAPLELDDPSHLQALLRAYERFPEIGGRAPP